MEAIVYHIPALLNETLEGLQIRPDGTYVDVTFGGGGHSRAIAERLTEGRLFSFDQDMDAYRNAVGEQADPERRAFWQQAEKEGRWQFVHSNFRYLKNFLDYYGVEPGEHSESGCRPTVGPRSAHDKSAEHQQSISGVSAEYQRSGVDGILADLGVSFHHFDEAERGFSFRFAGPLDMRMNQTGGKTAADVLNTYSEEELARVLYMYGEMKDSRRIAARIAKRRATEPILRTEQLVDLLAGGKYTLQDGEIEVEPFLKKDLARIFQALRIEVNDEMGALQEMLLSGLEMLRPGGKFVILTYHSLEDRMVKNFFKTGNLEGKIEKDFYGNVLSPFSAKSGKVIVAGEEEIERNPRSRSAKLRVATKL